MAIGYENRQVTKQSFAFNPTAPAQTPVNNQANQRGAQIVGGESSAGPGTAGRETNPGDMATGLGQYFGQLVEPYVQRKQQEKFFQGYTAAQSGIALGEISHPDSVASKIFGPSGYEKGA